MNIDQDLLIQKVAEQLSLPTTQVREAVESQYRLLYSFVNYPTHFGVRFPHLGLFHIRPQRIYPTLTKFIRILRKRKTPAIISKFKILWELRHILFEKSPKRRYYG